MSQVPSGTVTFAFTDVEGSTQRWERDRESMEEALRRHDVVVNEAIAAHDGYVFKLLGDGVCAAFSDPADAITAMLHTQRALAAEDFSAVDGLPVRVAVHTGTARERTGDYFGPAVNRTARLLAIGHGGQILISGATASIVSGDLPDEVALTDLGEHRLKDLARPERVFQLNAAGLRSDFPPLRSLNPATSNLPVQPNSFVGRDREVAEVTALLHNNRLVTLVGAGGVGKTRTALHVAANFLTEAPDGVWLIEFAPLSSGEHLASTIAHELGIGLAGKEPLAELTYELKSKRAFLVFDNCEHLIETVARTAAAILSVCPAVTILASSRQSLEIAGECVYRMPSLNVPEAVTLFDERAAAAGDRFALNDENAADVAEICRRLDGIPLAIELAASRTTILAPRQILDKLTERFRLLTQRRNDRLPRQQTLRALIDWSFDLLEPKERLLFERLSVFAGGWTLAAATEVCGGEQIDEWEVLDLLSALLAKSLVVVSEDQNLPRYRMLYSIREYSRERLVSAGSEPIFAAHARHYADVVASAAPLVLARDDHRWRGALSPELDNIRAAIDWSLLRGYDTRTGRRLLAAMEWSELLTTPQEAIGWFDAAANAPAEEGTEPLDRARILRHLVRLEWLVGRPLSHRERTASDALSAARASGDVNEVAQGLANLAAVNRDAGHFDEAESLFAQAYRNREQLSAIALNAVLRNWAVTNLQRGDVDTARRRFAEVAQRERPGSEAHASALLNLGELEFAVGNVESAREFAGKAREMLAKLDTAPLGLAICNLAAYAMAVDDLDQARELLREALRLLKRSGARWMTAAIEHHAVLAGLSGDRERAAVLLGFTEARYSGLRQRETTERQGYQRLESLLREAFDEDALQQRLSAGARLTEEEALEHAATISSTERSKD